MIRRTFLQLLGLAGIPMPKKSVIPYNPPHNSLQQNRLNSKYGIAERIYAKRWKKYNERHPAINSGFTSLEWILAPSGEWPEPVSDRDAEVAASVIQWLGTNCGLAFMTTCEDEIKKAEKH